jgi:hypothetical protein
METLLQHELLTNFVYPFLLIFFLVFAILEKTKLFGDAKQQLNALLSFVVGLIFIAAVRPKIMVENLILFMTIAIVIVFIVLLLWGFISGGDNGFKIENWMKWFLWVLAGVAVFIAVLWVTGIEGTIIDAIFGQDWSGAFWTNLIFIIIIALALAIVLVKNKK